MKLTTNANYILSEVAKGRSLCFAQDGEDIFLTSHPREFLDRTYDGDVQWLIRAKMIANNPDAEHWTDDHTYNITDAGRAALANLSR